jgi:predicted dienelactone hydrolase
MNKKHLKWIFYLAAPWILIIPFSGSLNLSKYFKTIILQPQKTGITTLHYFDQSRNRPIVTEVWYPVDKEAPAQASTGFWLRCDEARDAPLTNASPKYPLIVMSHGSGADRYTISWLAEVLTANGYIVAAMDHFGNTWNNKIPEYYARPWERPLDISFVLDKLLGASQFKDHIEQNKIGFVGYSLGGATGIWIAGAEVAALDSEYIKKNCIREVGNFIPENILENIDFNEAKGSFLDKRISAMVLMAPALGWLFDEKSLAKIKIPIVIFASENDQVVPIDMNAKVFAKQISQASLKIFTGEANHYIFLSRTTVIGKRFLDTKYCIDPKSIDRARVHEEIAKKTVIFFNNKLKTT